MTKNDQRKSLQEYLTGIINKSFTAIEHFPEGNEWGEIELMGMVRHIIEFDPPINKIINKVKRMDHRKNWFQDMGNGSGLLTQEEIDMNKEIKNGK